MIVPKIERPLAAVVTSQPDSREATQSLDCHTGGVIRRTGFDPERRAAFRAGLRPAMLPFSGRHAQAAPYPPLPIDWAAPGRAVERSRRQGRGSADHPTP